jgi:hypothetical protein
MCVSLRHSYIPSTIRPANYSSSFSILTESPLVSYFLAVGAASERQRGKVIVYSPGLVERGEEIFFATFAGLWPQWAAPVAYLYAALEVLTAAQRFLAGRRELRA